MTAPNQSTARLLGLTALVVALAPTFLLYSRYGAEAAYAYAVLASLGVVSVSLLGKAAAALKVMSASYFSLVKILERVAQNGGE
jgi:multidrug transporter EmrE-like cation transporter